MSPACLTRCWLCREKQKDMRTREVSWHFEGLSVLLQRCTSSIPHLRPLSLRVIIKFCAFCHSRLKLGTQKKKSKYFMSRITLNISISGPWFVVLHRVGYTKLFDGAYTTLLKDSWGAVVVCMLLGLERGHSVSVHLKNWISTAARYTDLFRGCKVITEDSVWAFVCQKLFTGYLCRQIATAWESRSLNKLLSFIHSVVIIPRSQTSLIFNFMQINSLKA